VRLENSVNGKLVLITGAGGRVGSALRPYLRDEYRLRLQYLNRPIERLVDSEEAVQADIEDFSTIERVVQGADAIVHLAGMAETQASWEEVRGPNVEGTYNVFEAARRAEVPKVVFASSNHVMGMYDRDRDWPIHPEQPVRPDGYYGVSKAFGEALARYYADAFDMSMICLRIGWVLDKPFNEQGIRMWLSPRDLGQLVRLSLETRLHFGLYYGVSNNTRSHWHIENARLELGYMPVGDSEVFASEVLGATSEEGD
jgi:NAD+ dependent glucose-6-phosphate dehydrogenase